MREIKVRFWDKVNKRFWYGGQEGDEAGRETFQTAFKDGVLTGAMLEPVSYGFKPVDDIQERILPSSVYTGQQDKNSREIYESDFLSDGKELYLVKYSWTETGMIAEGLKKEGVWSLFHLATGHNKDREIEVIGNIYENPELLKEGAEE